MLRLFPCLLLTVFLVDHGLCGLLQCKRFNEPCVPLPLNCCRGLSCKRDSLAGGFRCEQGRGLLGKCYTRGQLCTPDISNNPCCAGLVCRPRLINPSVHECERM